jgi:hypothetical protein
VEVAELLAAKSGGAAADAADLDMGTGFGVGHRGTGPLNNFFVVAS